VIRPAKVQKGTNVPHDPTLYRGSAAYYAHGRPPYSRALVGTLASEVGLDGAGRLLDVGCGPGVLTLALADYFAEALGLDPDAEMLAEGARRADRAGVANIRWVRARAEDIPALDLGEFKLVTFGQSFHWTDRGRVAEAVYEILEPGGALALIGHAHADRPRPPGPGRPPIPHDTIRALIRRYLGPDRRAGRGGAAPPAERHGDALARTRFGPARRIYCAGRPNIVQDIDGVLANYFSTSFAAPHLFGDRLEDFAADVRAELAARSPSGLYWDWPGDTEILLARKPG
jgi:SAM-dependent methyltransferase